MKLYAWLSDLRSYDSDPIRGLGMDTETCQKSKCKIKENATTLAALEQTPPIAPGSLGRTRTPQQRDFYGLGLGGLGFIGPLLRLQGLDAACAMRTPTAKAMAISRIHQSLESIRVL